MYSYNSNEGNEISSNKLRLLHTYQSQLTLLHSTISTFKKVLQPSHKVCLGLCDGLQKYILKVGAKLIHQVLVVAFNPVHLDLEIIVLWNHI